MPTPLVEPCTRPPELFLQLRKTYGLRSDYDPAFYRNADGSVMNNAQAADANQGLNKGLGGDEIQHPTHVTMNEDPGLTPKDIEKIGPPTESTVFHPDGSTSQMTPDQMRDAPGMPWHW